MKLYEKYKPSGIAWIGDVPEHWEVKRLKYVVKILSGYSPDQCKPTEYGQGVPYVKVDNLNIHKFDVEISNETVDTTFSISSKTCLIFPKRGAAIALNKVSLIVGPFCIDTNLMGIEPDEELLVPKFMLYFLKSISLISIADTSTIPQINNKHISPMLITLPQLPEQQTIARYLDQKTTEIDQLIAQKERLLALWEEEKTAVINQAVTRGLDAGAKMKDSGVAWLGEVPEHWEVKPLTKSLESIIDYRGRTPEKLDQGIFLVTARNIKKGKIDYSLSQEYVEESQAIKFMQRGEVKIGDVLFTTEAPLGEVANLDREDIVLAQRIIKFRGKENLLNNYYLKFWLMSHCFQSDLQKYATGSTAIGIKSSKLSELTALLPPLPEQTAIVRHIETQTVHIQQQMDQTRKLIELLKEYRATLISEVVTGKIKIME